MIKNNKKMKNKFIIAVAFLALSISACNSNKQEKEEEQEEQQESAVATPPVEIVPVEKGKLSSIIAVPGELIPYQQVDLYAKVNSYVKKLLVDIGSEVHQGEHIVPVILDVERVPANQ